MMTNKELRMKLHIIRASLDKATIKASKRWLDADNGLSVDLARIDDSVEALIEELREESRKDDEVNRLREEQASVYRQHQDED